uniref:Tafazzin family protein n=1 Tax=Ciona savignyi TaxID=51511 RepID=H2YHE4_CIOSA
MVKDLGWPFPSEPKPIWWRWSSFATVASISLMSKFWFCYINSIKIFGAEKLHKAVHNRPNCTSLITVANHHCCVDDSIICATLPWSTAFKTNQFRWTLGAKDICFTKMWHNYFFAWGKIIPVARGEGVFQKGMDFAVDRLNKNEWVHVFPEGGVNMDKTWIRFKWGVGRLISECQRMPIVLPLYHLGSDSVLPNHKPYIPAICKKVTVLVGDPLDLNPHLKKCTEMGMSAAEIRKTLTTYIQEEMEKLRIIATELH